MLEFTPLKVSLKKKRKKKEIGYLRLDINGILQTTLAFIGLSQMLQHCSSQNISRAIKIKCLFKQSYVQWKSVY